MLPADLFNRREGAPSGAQWLYSTFKRLCQERSATCKEPDTVIMLSKGAFRQLTAFWPVALLDPDLLQICASSKHKSLLQTFLGRAVLGTTSSDAARKLEVVHPLCMAT